MNCDGALLAELLLGFVHLSDEVDEAFSRLGNSLLGPVRELELPHCARLAVLTQHKTCINTVLQLQQNKSKYTNTHPCIGDLELAQNVLRHVVLSDGVDDEVLVARGAVAGPVLVALLASHLALLAQHDHDRRVVLPQHPPEVLRRLGERTLSCDVGATVAIALKVPHYTCTNGNTLARSESTLVLALTSIKLALM